MAGTTNSTDSDLPVIGKQHKDQDDSDLPVLKKKGTGAGPIPSPSASSLKPDQTGPSVDTSASGSKAVTANFKNNSLTPEDVSSFLKRDYLGISPEQVSTALNNKGKNIKAAENAPSNKNTASLLKEKNDLDAQLERLNASTISSASYRPEDIQSHKQKIQQLEARRDYVNGELNKTYNWRKEKIVPEIADQLKGLVDDSEYDPETHKLRPVSVEWVARHVDEYMNKLNDPNVNAVVSGDLNKKNGTYEDITRAVVDELNLRPIRKAQEDFKKEYFKDHPEMQTALNAGKDISDYFSKEKFDDVNARVKANTDKSFMETQERYYGDGGIFQKNSEYVGIQHKYAQLVADGKMTKHVAIKQMQAEIDQTPSLKSIKKNFDADIKKTIEGASKQYEKYVIQGLLTKHPEYTVYEDGSIGLKSMPKDEFDKMEKGYIEGLENVTKKIADESQLATLAKADEKAKKQGAFLGSMLSTVDQMAAGLTKAIFNKTGWGGHEVRYFQSQEIAGTDINQSDIAKSWNLKGWESLFHPSFYASGAGKMMPLLAGGAAVTLATEGEGVPEYISWLANAGLFTAQSSLSTYNSLLNSRDKNGNLLSEEDAGRYAAKQASEDFLPNFLMMAVGSGALLRAKNIAKPTIAGVLGKSVKGLAQQQPFFSWQGYNEYHTMREAQGRDTDLGDYLQSSDFRDNLINGVVMGAGFSLLHAPGTYRKGMNAWEKFVHTSPESEFKNLVPQNYALAQEYAGNGNFLRDALKLKIFNTDPSTLDEQGKRELADTQNQLLYSTNLDRNIKAGNLDPKNINDLYQAHNLALADQHDYLADKAANDKNKSLSDIYKDKAKEYREQAKSAADNAAKFHYLIGADDNPIFLSDKSFKELESSGKIAEWMKDGTVKSVHANDDPEFSKRYADYVGTKAEASVEGKDILDHAADLVEQNKDKLGPFYFQAKANPEQFLNTVSEAVKEDENKAREQYGNDIVDLAKVLYPEEIKQGGSNEKLSSPEEGANQPGKVGTGTEDSDGRVPEGKPVGSSDVSEPTDQKVKVGDEVQWTSQGVNQFESPQKIVSLSEDGQYAFVEGSSTGIPVDQLTISSPKKEGGQNAEEIRGHKEQLPQAGQAGAGMQADSGGNLQQGTETGTKAGDQENQVTEGGAPEAPPATPPPSIGHTDEGLHPKDEKWTSIQKKDLSEKVQKENAFTQTNRETIDKVVSRLSSEAAKNGRTWQSQAEYEVNQLHGQYFNEDGSIKKAFNPTTEELALIGMRLMDINGEAEMSEFNPDDDQQVQRIAYLESEKNKAERLLSFGEAGRAFQFRQSLLKMGVNGDIQIKRKAISILTGVKMPETEEEFDQLTDEEKKKIKPLYDAFNNWKDAYEKENKQGNASNEKFSQEEFEKRVKDAVDQAIKDKNTPLNKEKAKNVASKLRNFADKVEKFGRSDLPEGTQKMSLGPDLQKSVADAIRWIADKLESGELKIPELLKEAVSIFKGNNVNEDELLSNIKDGLKEAGISEDVLNDKTRQEKLFDKLSELAKTEKSDDITQKMVDRGLIRDYLHELANRGVDVKDILKEGSKRLKEIFPKLDEKELRDAYLKEGNYAPDTSKILEDKIKSASKTFRDVTILERDIEALETGDKLYGADKEHKKTIISDYEKKLKEEKDNLLKERHRAEQDIKDAKVKADKLAEYDQKIKDIVDHQKVWEKAKAGKNIDKDLAEKREKLRQTLIKNGIKLETGSKESQQAKENVIKGHNQRVGDLTKKISDALTDGTLPEKTKKMLESIKSSLDKMSVKIDAGDLSTKIKKAIAEANRIFNSNITNLVNDKTGIFKDLKNLSNQLKKDNDSALDKIQLTQLKDREISRKETAERKLAAGEFDDEPRLSNFKKDEEFLKLQRDRIIAERNLKFQAEKYNKQNMSFWQRQLERLSRLQRANLISGIMTNGKVLLSGVVKPVSDALIRRTIGTITEPLFRSIGIKGDREVLNNDATIKSFEDSFKGMTAKKAAEIRGKADSELENATLKFQEANDRSKELETNFGKDSKEYKDFIDGDFTKAKNDYQAAQYQWAGSVLYDFIPPGAWRDRLNILTKGISSFEERLMGPKGGGWADEKSKHAIGTGINRILYALEMFGRIHGVEKDVSARQAFVEGYLKRAFARIKEGEQLTPSKLDGIALESFPNFLGGKFQNKNEISDAIRGAEQKAQRKGTTLGKAFAFWLRSSLPVLKVPLNIDFEGYVKYPLGVPIAIGKTMIEIGKALKVNDISIKEGLQDFNTTMDAVREHMNSLPAEQRDKIIEYANKGIFGAAMVLISGSMAASGNLVFGGVYGDKNPKKRQFLNAEGEMEDLNYGEIALNGHKLGKFWSAVVGHLPITMPSILAASYVQKYKDERGDIKSDKNKTMAAFDGLTEVVRTAWEESALKSLGDIAKSPANIFSSFTTQMAAKNISEFYDTDENGTLIPRKPENVWQEILMRTGGRKFVPTKEEADQNKADRADDLQQEVQDRKEGDPYYDKNKK